MTLYGDRNMKKLNVNILYLSLTVLTLSGCTTENKNVEANLSQTKITTEINKNAETKVDLTNDSAKININLALMQNNLKQIPILRMEEKINDFEAIRKVFFQDRAVKEEYWENDLGKAISYISEKEDKLDIYKGYMKYATTLGNHVRSIFNPKSAEISSNKSKQLFDLFNLVKESSELSFKPKNEAIREAVDFCKNLGIEVDSNTPVVYALEYNKINELQKQLLEEDFFLKEFEAKELDSNDSCYYMVFEIKQDGLSIDPSGYSDGNTGKFLNGSSIIMIVSSRGMEYFETLGSLYEKKEVIEDNPRLANPQSCLNIFIDKYENNLMVKEVNVINVKLCYVPILKKDSDNIIFQPTWIFYSEVELMVDEKSGQTHKLRDVMRIDAITAEEIIG